MIERAGIAPGTTTTVGFTGVPGSKVFFSRVGPDGPARLRVVVCPPVGGEAARNYRREVLLSRHLAAKGVDTIRFHYRGSGHSDPSEHDGFESMVADADLIRRSFSDELPTVWMGTRLGTLVAARMTATEHDQALVMWDPVLDATAYFREILRARVFSAFRSDETGTAPKADLIKDLQSSGSTDLLGYRIASTLLDEVSAGSSLQSMAVQGRHILMVDLRRKGDPRNEVLRLGSEWEAAGANVTVAGVALYEPWWYGARSGSAGDEHSDPNTKLLEITADFVTGLDGVAP